MAFHDSGLRIVRHIWFVKTKREFATLHCVRLSPDWGGIAKSLRHGRASRGIEMRLYGFGRYFHQNRDIGDRLPFGGPAQGLAPWGATIHCARVLAFASRHNIYCARCQDIDGLANIRRRDEYSLCSAAALREPTREGRPRSCGHEADFETLIQEFPASAARGALAPHIACGSLEDFSPVSSSGSEDASPRLRAFALRASGSPAIRSRPATSRSRSRRGCAGPSG